MDENLSNKKELLHFFYDNNEKNYCYRLVFQSRKDLLSFKDSLANNKDIQSLRIDMQE